jgi:hypothetical protein
LLWQIFSATWLFRANQRDAFGTTFAKGCADIEVKTMKFLITALLLVPTLSWANESIEDFLHEFHKNPAQMMQRLPSYVDDNGVVVPRGPIRENAAGWKTFIETRDEIRRDMIRTSLDNPPEEGAEDEGPSAGPDRPDLLVEPGPMIRNLSEMQGRGLTQVVSPVTPWADSYWPIYKGLLANRYADGSVPDMREWSANYSFSLSHPASAIVASGDSNRINNLSPAEKYDFVMGDMNFSLTAFSWKTGEKYQKSYNMVPKWVGICHGWSGAAHMNMPIPKSPVTVRAVNGTPVTFFPQDIKALQSMLWAKGAPQARIAGSRCNVFHPKRNKNGRIIDPSCFDVSPSTWHLGIVNQLGAHQRTFVMDNTYDHEVWNFPILSFKYRYFNPQTWKESANVEAATVPIEKYTVDKFSEFRSHDARYVVGVFMDVTYVVEITPTRKVSDAEPPTKTARYIYDLELDANHEIIGGEWYSNAHPDFIWTFNKDSQAQAPQDPALAADNWTIDYNDTESWTDAARRASSRGIPLNSFVQKIANP